MEGLLSESERKSKGEETSANVEDPGALPEFPDLDRDRGSSSEEEAGE